MSAKNIVKLLPVVLCTAVILLIVGVIYFLISSEYNESWHNEKTVFSLKHKDKAIVALGQTIYAANCASCHGVTLQGQANWRQRNAAGYLPAPPHDETGHTWHHTDSYLFLMTKFGIEKMLGQAYPNNMPAYEDLLNDEEILAALSYIKSTWSKRIQLQHDQINARSKAQ